MALTYSVKRQGIEDNHRWVECDVTFDNTYPTGGEAVDLAAIGLRTVNAVHIVFAVYPDGNATAYTAHGQQIVPVLTNPSAPLLKVNTSLNTEGAGSSDQSGVVSRLRFIGSA